MKLYHGSNTAFSEIDLSVCRPNKDFGRGFYLAPDRLSAERMALSDREAIWRQTVRHDV